MEGTTNYMDYNGMGNGGYMWVILIFLILAGGRGLGNFGGNMLGSAISNDFLYTNLNTALGQGFTQVTNQNFGIKDALNAGFANVAQCCCETNRNIDSVRSDISGAVGTIINNNNQNTQSILSAICDLKTSHLEEELAKARQTIATLQGNQNSDMNRILTIEALRPKVPAPAYVVNPTAGCIQTCTQGYMY